MSSQIIPLTDRHGQFDSQYFQFVSENNHEIDPEFVPPPDNELDEDTKAKMERTQPVKVEKFGLIVEEKLVGYSHLITFKESFPGYEENKHLGLVDIFVAKGERRQGYGSQLLEHLIIDAKDKGLRLLQSTIRTESGSQFATQRQGIKISEGSVNRLYLDAVDWDLMSTWADKEFNSEFIEEVPESILEQFCELYDWLVNHTTTDETAERGPQFHLTPQSRRADEQKYQLMGWKWHTLIVYEEDGNLAGLTEMIHDPNNPRSIRQNLTGVREKSRGRGMGKYLKAKMLLEMREKYPEITYVETGNNSTNRPMLRINDQMGFQEAIRHYNYVLHI